MPILRDEHRTPDHDRAACYDERGRCYDDANDAADLIVGLAHTYRIGALLSWFLR